MARVQPPSSVPPREGICGQQSSSRFRRPRITGYTPPTGANVREIFLTNLLWLGACSPKTDTPPGKTDPTGDSASDESGALDEGKVEGDPATISLNGACPLDSRAGSFQVASNPSYAVIGGSAADKVLPSSILTEETALGDCRLLRRGNPFCSPSCAPGEACDWDGNCVPYPENQDLGTIGVRGLREPVAMEPVVPGNTYFVREIVNPPFNADQIAQVHADSVGLLLHGVSPEPLGEPPLDWLIGSEPLALSWNPPSGLARAEVQLELTIDQHGISPLRLECRFPDTGAAQVPGELIESLLASGVSGFPNGILRRQTMDHQNLRLGGEEPVCVELRVAEERLARVEVSGHTPCDSNDDCPLGQICNLELETCQ